MDATQLTLFSGSRPQASTKLTPPLGDDTQSADQAFASMLQKSLTETQQQRQLDLDRQNWRNQPSSYTASQPPQSQTPSAPSDSAGKSQPAEKAPQGRHDHAQDTSSKSTTATEPTSSNKTSATTDQTDTKSSGKTGKSTGEAAKDGDQSSGDQTASAAGNPAIGKQDAHHHNHMADGDSSSGDGKNQGQNPQDGKSQQSAADGTDGSTAAVEGVEGAVLAGLIITQTPTPAAGTGSHATSTGGKNAAAGLTAGAQAAGAQAAGANGQAVPATQNTSTNAGTNANAAATAAGLASGLSTPSPSTSSAASAPAQASNSAISNALPQAAAPLTAETKAGATQSLDTTFANIIAKKTASPAANSDNLHMSMGKSNRDDAPQLPRPLVRIDDSQPSQPSAQPAPTLTEEALTVASGSDTFDASLNQQDFGIDDLQGFNPLSTMLPGAGLAGLGKQVDMMTALRQQLATASLQDQVAIHMQRAAGNNVDKISIDLSPAELGRIHVKMSVDDDKQVSAHITVERSTTLDLLQRDTKALERALQDAGLKTDSGSLSFSLQRGNQGDSSDTPGWGQNGGRQIGSSGQEKTATTADVSSATAKNSVDTANGLVDVAV